ncbi:cell division protein SepF [Bacillus sp. AFS076308]|uniref:cell division protein SepF n=1 Tax=unclassified Bacillus (in: firmicutes) TaxID=185979 RepID=UPI000BF29F6C|nr:MULTISPECIES: cell division protein SepF [unclassified Bacillus (in: firmicutes)]PFO05962.1 cell division protein SepF [Bacillus sp. AFS076308]PGV48990.1 cell division protein SepF [Bacillus sp. AFS037270]
MTIKSKLKTFFFLDDEYDNNNDEVVEKTVPVKPKQQTVKSQNVVNFQTVPKPVSSTNTSKASKVILVEPITYSESTEIADHLKNRRAVVVNLQSIDREQGRQIVDFLSGAVYAIGGDIQKIGSSIFLCTPDNVEVAGNISELLPEHNNPNTRW